MREQTPSHDDSHTFTFEDRHWRVRGCAAREQVRPEEVRFTQRELRETLNWQDRALRRQLRRLVQLEYVVAYRTGPGNARAYQLVYDPETEAASWHLGLSDAGQLERYQDHVMVLEAPPPKR